MALSKLAQLSFAEEFLKSSLLANLSAQKF